MPSISPLTTVFVIVLGVTLLGAVAAYVRDRARFSGYQQVTGDALRLARALHGEVFRDGADLVISGNWERLPVMVRFSHAENTPGLSIRMGAPATFSFSVIPNRDRDAGTRSSLRTADETFNARFSIRSDDPTQARIFIEGRQALICLQKLCRSAENYLVVKPGLVELADLAPPTQQSVAHVVQDLHTMAKFAAELRAMPGGETVKVDTLRPERRFVLRAALAMGVLAAVAAIFMAARAGEHNRPATPEDAIPAGIWPADARLMLPLKNWRLAQAEDFEPAAVSWLRGNGQQITGRVPGDYCGSGGQTGVAYMLVGADNFRRLVLLCNHQNRYDIIYPGLAIIARFPHHLFDTINWAGKVPSEPDGDGLLIVRSSESPASGLVVFTRGGQVNTAVPLNYQSITLE